MLIEKKLLAPTLQAIFRRSNRMVVTDEDYFSGKAHPVVFDATQLDEEKMVRLAHEITPDSIPPVAVIEVKDETRAERGRQWFEPEGGQYFTATANTPVSIGRIFRENTAEHGFLVSLDKSFAASTKQKLSARLVVLQGDPRFVTIEQQPGTTLARVRVRWQPPVPGVGDGKELRFPGFVSAGAQDFISKPFDPVNLLARISRLIKLRAGRPRHVDLASAVRGQSLVCAAPAPAFRRLL